MCVLDATHRTACLFVRLSAMWVCVHACVRVCFFACLLTCVCVSLSLCVCECVCVWLRVCVCVWFSHLEEDVGADVERQVVGVLEALDPGVEDACVCVC